MFRDRPALAAEMLAGPLGVAVPAFDRAGVSSGDLTDVAPTEYRADAVITLTKRDDVALAVVVEAQLRADARKRRSWPAYVATLHARMGCPVMLLVVAPDPAAATWCAAPISLGHPGFVLTPLVLGPHQVPVVKDVGAARRAPEVAVLSAIAHGAGAEQKDVLEALRAAFEVLDQERAELYTDVVLAALPAAVRDYLEAVMHPLIQKYGYQSDFARRFFEQGEAKGKAEGEAEAVLTVLDARGIAVTDDAREEIVGCTDLGQLETWVRRATTADKIEDLFQ